MEKNIYEALNEAIIEMDEQDKENFTEIDKKRMKKNLRKVLKQPKGLKRKWLVAAGLLVGISILNPPVLANMQLAMESIASHMGLEKDISDYTTVVGKSITDNGVTLALNEVVLNNDELIVSTTAQAEQFLGAHRVDYDAEIYINGKPIYGGATGSSWEIDERTHQTIMEYDLKDIDLEGDLKVKIHFKRMDVGEQKIRGNWTFEFMTTGEQLCADTKITPIGYTFQLEDGSQVILDVLKSNALGHKIYFEIEQGEEILYDIRLQGYDNLGNEISFFLSKYSIEDGGQLELDRVNDEIVNVLDEQVTTLTLTPYAVAFPEGSGKLSNDFETVGETFKIELQP